MRMHFSPDYPKLKIFSLFVQEKYSAAILLIIQNYSACMFRFLSLSKEKVTSFTLYGCITNWDLIKICHVLRNTNVFIIRKQE